MRSNAPRPAAVRAARGSRPLAALALAAAIAAGGCGGDGGAATAPTATEPAPQVGPGRGGVKLKRIGVFEQPVWVAQPPGSEDLYVVEKTGRVRVVRDGDTLPRPFLDLSGEVSTATEQGLLSIAFAPDYEDSGRAYAFYTDREGDERVIELRRSQGDPDRVDRRSRRELLHVQDFAANHNGGLLLFGPDGMLYVGLGDGGGAGDPERNGQDLGALLGKILRIDPEPSGGRPYTIPADNPFTRRPGARSEIYAYGLRNPWRFSFDRETGALAIGDVGQDEFEEIDYVTADRAAGANFGWSAYEGEARFNSDQRAPGHVRPVLTYPLEDGNCAVTGGYVVRDRALRPLYGRYIYGDYCGGELRSFSPRPGRAAGDRALGLRVPALSSFAEDQLGRIYATSLNGSVFRLVAAGGRALGAVRRQ